MTTKFPLGFFGSNPDASSVSANAQFESDYNSYVAVMGTRPVTMDGFVDDTLSPSAWVANAQFTAYSWAQTGTAYVGPTSGTTPVIGLPMSLTQTSWSNIDSVFQSIISGAYDSYYIGIVDAWADEGYKTLDLRIGYEFDGNYMPWGTGNSSSPTVVQDFIAAWQHIANLVHAEGQVDGITVNTVWNPAVSSWTNQAPTTLYPGNQYVDIIGTDTYSTVTVPALVNWSATNPAQLSGTSSSSTAAWAQNTANLDHYWTYTNANQWQPTGQAGTGWSIQQAIELAEATGKPLGIAETGAGGNGTTNGPVDDAAFPAWLASELSQPGAPQIAFVNIWADDESDGNWGFLNGEKPQEAAAWAEYFGASSSTVPNGASMPSAPINIPSNSTATILGSGNDQLTLEVSENAYLSNAAFTISVDGKQVGGVQTVTAQHGAADQTFVVEGSWGTGAQTVSISFVNPASGAGQSRALYVDSESYDGVNTYFPLQFTGSGAQSVTVGVVGLPQATFTDDKGNTLTQAVISSGSQSTYMGRLDGNVFQWISAGTNFLSTSSFGVQVLSADLTDGTGRSFNLTNFETVDLGVSGASNGGIALNNVAGGYIREDDGNYTNNVTVKANCGASASVNTFDISLGSGNDIFNLNANAGYGHTVVNAVSTTGTHSWSFIYPASVNFVEEGGTDTVTMTGGTNNQFHAGGGNLTVNATGGSNDAYYFSSGDGFMTIDNFSTAHGDSLWLDSTLKNAMHVTSDGQGGTEINFTVSTVGIDLKNVSLAAFNPGIIHWT